MRSLFRGLVAAFVIVSVLFAPLVFAQGPTADQVKEILSTPLALFVLMLVGSFGSVLKRMNDARRTSTAYTHHWPETLLMLGGNMAGFLILLMADQLNFAAVITGGYAVNSLASMARPTDGSKGPPAD